MNLNGLAEKKSFTLWNGRKLETPTFFYSALKGLDKALAEHFTLDKVLISAYDVLWSGKKLKKLNPEWVTQKFIKHNDDAFIFLDSGGYSFRNKQMNVSPQNILDLYDVLQPDMGATLDHPFAKNISLTANYNQRWLTTLSNTEHMYEHAKDDNLITVIHGWNEQQIKKTVSDLRKVFKKQNIDNGFDFIALGSSTAYSTADSNPAGFSANLTKVIIYLRKEFPDAFFHVFGGGSLKILLNLYYLGVDSTDSAMWRIASIMGDIILPKTLNRITMNTQKYKLIKSDKTQLENCNCPSCAGLDIESIIHKYDSKGENDRDGRAIHNFYVVKEFVQFIEMLIKEHRLETYMDEFFGSINNKLYTNLKRSLNKKLISNFY